MKNELMKEKAQRLAQKTAQEFMLSIKYAEQMTELKEPGAGKLATEVLVEALMAELPKLLPEKVEKDTECACHAEGPDSEKCCAVGMDFGDAIRALKDGERVAREGWNGKGMYVLLAHEADFVTDADISAFDQLEVEVADMLVLKTAQDTFQPGWLASQADMLAEDWYIVE